VYVVGPGFATVLANFQVFIVAAFGVIVLKERLSWRLAVGVPAAAAGVLLLIAPRWTDLPPSYKTGVGYGLVAALCYSGYLLTLRRAGTNVAGSPFAVMTAVTAASLVAFGALAAAQGERLEVPSGRDFAYLAAYGVTAQVFAWVLVLKGLSRVPASRAGLVLLLQPSLAFLWDVAFFARPMSVWDGAGLGLALGAIYLGTTAARDVP